MGKYTIIAGIHDTHQGRFKNSKKNKEYTEKKTKKEYIGILKFIEMDFGR